MNIKSVLTAVACTAWAFLFWYVFHPPLNPMHGTFWLTWIFALAPFAGVAVYRLNSRAAEVEVYHFVIVLGLLLGGFVLWVLYAVMSSEWVRAGSHRAALGTVTQAEMHMSLPPLDLARAPLVDGYMARRAAEKRLSEVPGWGSRYQIGELEKQIVAGNLYWVGFVEHRSFSTWLFGEKTVPGYVKVSASDPSDVSLVREAEGQPLSMRYLSSALFSNNAERMFRFHALTAGIADISPEIDDNGRPYYVGTRFRFTVGNAVPDAVGITTLDVQTGEMKDYGLDEVPAWIDRVQPQMFIAGQASKWGRLVRGKFNFAMEEVMDVSGAPDLVFGSDGAAYFYIGLASAGADRALAGYLLVNTRTKETRQYAIPGAASEQVARNAAEMVMKEKGYLTTNALPFMVDNTPTYITVLVDGEGITRAYAMIAMQNFQVVATGETLQATYRQYVSRLARESHVLTAEGTTAGNLTEKHTYTVERIGQEIRGGNVFYIMSFDEVPGKLFVATSDQSEALAVTREGDRLEVEFAAERTSAVRNILAIRNLRYLN